LITSVPNFEAKNYRSAIFAKSIAVREDFFIAIIPSVLFTTGTILKAELYKFSL
jgi:hypothetical protein